MRGVQQRRAHARQACGLAAYAMLISGGGEAAAIAILLVVMLTTTCVANRNRRRAHENHARTLATARMRNAGAIGGCVGCAKEVRARTPTTLTAIAPPMATVTTTVVAATLVVVVDTAAAAVNIGVVAAVSEPARPQPQ